MIDITPYNPLDKRNLGASVAEALLERKAHPLAEVAAQPFEGAGIYVIYYTGPFPAYAPIADRNRDGLFAAPIYIGKAVPLGARKGNIGLDSPPGRALFNRLREHSESISLATNLNLGDFWCRALVVEDIWIPLGESLLIARYAPLWNKLVDGFGNHDPGKGRYQGLRPRWDVLHPGRAWAERCQVRLETADQIMAEVASYLAVSAFPAKPGLLGGEDAWPAEGHKKRLMGEAGKQIEDLKKETLDRLHSVTADLAAYLSAAMPASQRYGASVREKDYDYNEDPYGEEIARARERISEIDEAIAQVRCITRSSLQPAIDAALKDAEEAIETAEADLAEYTDIANNDADPFF